MRFNRLTLHPHPLPDGIHKPQTDDHAMRLIPLSCLIFLLTLPLSGTSAPIKATLEGEATCWQKTTFALMGVPKVQNPFDTDEIRIDALITAPSGKRIRVPAFWMQPYTRSFEDGNEALQAAGAGGWYVRITPSETGVHQLVCLSSLSGAPDAPGEATVFEVRAAPPASRHGFVRLAPQSHHFQTGDGKLLKLIGVNLCWPEGRGTYDYDRWLESMAASGQNFFRLWMAPWFLPFEHQPGTLNCYPQDAAFQLDYLFEKAAELGMYAMISFDHHGMFQKVDPTWGGSNAFWNSSNPYSAQNGGPCAEPNDFFTSSAAKHTYQKKLRYLIARYGYSTQLLNWQFFNEIDNAFTRAPLIPEDVYRWHAEMADWLQQHDPYDHLVSTSLTGASDRPGIWQIPELDFSVFHSYWDPAPARFNAKLAASFLQRYGKPYMVGEFGTHAFHLNLEGDPYLRGFRQGLWGGVMGGSVGTSLSWWWEELHRQNAYPIFATLAKTLALAGWEQGDWKPVELAEAPQPRELGEPLAGAEPFTADLALTPNDRMHLSGQVAIANELAARRAGEFLQSYLRPASMEMDSENQVHWVRDIQPSPVGMELVAWFASGGSFEIHLNGVERDTMLRVEVDGSEVLAKLLVDTDGATKNSNELNQILDIPLDKGHHQIRLINPGSGWIQFNRIRLRRVQPATFKDNWSYQPEVLALANREGHTVLYVVSPHVVYPSGARDFHPPMQRGKTVQLTHLPTADYKVQWFHPVSGAQIETVTLRVTQGPVTLTLPEFNEDLVGVLLPVTH